MPFSVALLVLRGVQRIIENLYVAFPFRACFSSSLTPSPWALYVSSKRMFCAIMSKLKRALKLGAFKYLVLLAVFFILAHVYQVYAFDSYVADFFQQNGV